MWQLDSFDLAPIFTFQVLSVMAKSFNSKQDFFCLPMF